MGNKTTQNTFDSKDDNIVSVKLTSNVLRYHDKAGVNDVAIAYR